MGEQMKAPKLDAFECLTVTSVEVITDDADWDVDYNERQSVFSGGIRETPADAQIESKEVPNLGGDLAEAAIEEAVPVELTDEEKLAALEAVLDKRKSHREIFYKILDLCRTRQMLPELEAAIAAFPEFKTAAYDQYLFITLLEESYGLIRFELDEQGNEVLPEQKEGLTEDELDDLIWDFAFETTEYGKQIVEKHAPQKRMLDLFSLQPARKETYLELMEYCKEQARSYKEIEALLKDRPIMWLGREGEAQPLMASVFVEKLEAAGGIVYENGWQITAKGKEILQLMLEG